MLYIRGFMSCPAWDLNECEVADSILTTMANYFIGLLMNSRWCRGAEAWQEHTAGGHERHYWSSHWNEMSQNNYDQPQGLLTQEQGINTQTNGLGGMIWWHNEFLSLWQWVLNSQFSHWERKNMLPFFNVGKTCQVCHLPEDACRKWSLWRRQNGFKQVRQHTQLCFSEIRCFQASQGKYKAHVYSPSSIYW